MTDKHQMAKLEIRRRQTEIAQRLISEGKSVRTKDINSAFQAAGLPEEHDPIKLEQIVNGFESDPTPEQLLQQAEMMGRVAAFLREGNFQSLADAMTKLGLSREELSAVLEQRDRKAAGKAPH